MFKIIFKIMIVLAAVGTILAIISWYTIRHISTQKATKSASNLLESISSPQATEDEKIIAITTKVFDVFKHKNPTTIPLYKLRPYITNKRLPEFIRFPNGVMETNLKTGYCDNAARMLAFLLKQEGFSSVQWNMVTNRNAHSALSVTLSDGRKVFVDPFYGFVAIDKNSKLTNLETAKKRVESGEKLENVLLSINDKSNISFFRNISNMYMAAEGDNLVIKAKLPVINDYKPIFFGKIDGQSNDVRSATSTQKMSPHWDYMGHKYNREWVRVLEVSQPVKIVMTLVQPVEDGILIASPKPKVEGKTLIWTLDKGEPLTLHDGLAKISLKRLNSYIDIDQIIAYPLN